MMWLAGTIYSFDYESYCAGVTFDNKTIKNLTVGEYIYISIIHIYIHYYYYYIYICKYITGTHTHTHREQWVTRCIAQGKTN